MIPLLIGGILSALKYAPSVLSAGAQVVAALTGEEVPPEATAEDIAAKIEALPPEQKAVAIGHVLAAQTRAQELDTDRFKSMNDGDAEKLRASARPEIALQAMAVLTMFARGMRVLFWATVAEWAFRLGCYFFGAEYPDISLWGLIAEAAPVSEMIWAPLLASFYASIRIIEKYMGCRERDKAHEYEIAAGRPLNSTAATVEAAGGALAGLVKAVRRG